jgi:hypothetical protein
MPVFVPPTEKRAGSILKLDRAILQEESNEDDDSIA